MQDDRGTLFLEAGFLTILSLFFCTWSSVVLRGMTVEIAWRCCEDQLESSTLPLRTGSSVVGTKFS